MKFRREEYLDLMTFSNIERQMFVELFGPLVGLEDEWKLQGASDDELSLIAFDWDYVHVVDCGGNMGIRTEQQPVVIEETDKYIIEKDVLGRTTKLYKNSS